MNWGLKIVLGLGAFMLFIIGAGIYMVTKNTDTLEDIDYYKKSLDYDHVYQGKQNLEDDDAKPDIQVQGDTLYIAFKHAGNKGDLIFKRPSDGSLDLTLPFLTHATDYQLPVSTFKKGNWKLEINWQHGSTLYISTHSLFL